MAKQNNQPTGRLTNNTTSPQPTKNGVRVYYDGKTEHFLRGQAKARGFRNVQEMLKHDAVKARESAEGKD